MELVRPVEQQRRCALYRHFDDEDVLLYVGITDDLGGRTNSGHARTSDWVRFAERADAEWYDTREQAAAAEREAVEEEGPIFNRQYALGDVDRRILDYVHGRELRALNSIIALYEKSVRQFLGTVPDQLLDQVTARAADSYRDYGLTDERALPAVLLEEVTFASRARAGAIRDEASLAAFREVLEFVEKKVAVLQDPWSAAEPPF